MKLYAIRNKQSGLYFVHGWNAQNFYWNETGAFWKQIDTVKKHLLNLVYIYEYRKGVVSPSGFVYDGNVRIACDLYAIRNYVVEENEVHFDHAKKVISAGYLLGLKQLVTV